MHDTDNDGTITLDEYRKVRQQQPVCLSEAEHNLTKGQFSIGFSGKLNSGLNVVKFLGFFF